MAYQEACMLLAAASTTAGMAILNVSCHPFVSDEGTIEQHRGDVEKLVGGPLGPASVKFWTWFKAHVTAAELPGEVKKVLKEINSGAADHFIQALATWPPVRYCTEHEEGHGHLPALLLPASSVMRAMLQLSALPRPLPAKVVDMVEIADKMLWELVQMLLKSANVEIPKISSKEARQHLIRWSAGVRKALDIIAFGDIPAGLADVRKDTKRSIMSMGGAQEMDNADTTLKQLVHSMSLGPNNQRQSSTPSIAAYRGSMWKEAVSAAYPKSPRVLPVTADRP